MTPAVWLAVAVAGSAGALARYLLDRAVIARAPSEFPYGTLLVNVSGSLVLGFVTGLALYHGLGANEQLVVGAGFCGAYTTFSTLTFESLALVEQRDVAAAVVNLAGSTALGLLAAAAGLLLAAVA